MKTENRRVDLLRSEAEYLSTSGFLPTTLLDCLKGIAWGAGAAGTLAVPVAAAEQFREAFTEQLAKVGFDEAYEPTEEGRLLENLIDRFHEES
jgi:hypothetical protein